jgi:hypothetical protein
MKGEDMETTKRLFESIVPPDYIVKKVPVRGVLAIGNIRYRLLTLPKINERSVWSCRIVTRVDYDGASKEVEEGIEFDGPFILRHSNLIAAVDVWTLNLG